MMARLVTLLPEPLSPTMPSVSPSPTPNDTPSTARTGGPSVRNSTCRSRISRSGSGMSLNGLKRVDMASPRTAVRGLITSSVSLVLQSWIEGVAQSVAEEIECEQRHTHRQRGKHEQPPKDFYRRDDLESFVREQPPRDVRRLHAKAEERQERLVKHHSRNR